MFGADANFQPDRAMIARVDWFDQFAPLGVSQKAAAPAAQAAQLPQAGDGVIETVTVEASRLPKLWVLAGMVVAGVYVWRASRR